MSDRRKHLKALKADKAYRDAYMAEHVRAGIAFQIKALRGKKTQAEFGAQIGTSQDVLSSRYENPDYDTVSLKKLIEIAQSLDIGLVVRFVDYNKFLDTYEDVSDAALQVTAIGDLQPEPAHETQRKQSPASVDVAFIDLDELATSITILGHATTNSGDTLWLANQGLSGHNSQWPLDSGFLIPSENQYLSRPAHQTTGTFTQTTAYSKRRHSISHSPSRRSGTVGMARG